TSTIADAVIEANQGREDSEEVYSETENDTEESETEESVSEEDLKEFVENSEEQSDEE
ncbi:MAG: 30S ribosomal protein S2, partial [Finegoldia magna]|nr:30S ribosomal protein S2 [Finegoldia magna]